MSAKFLTGKALTKRIRKVLAGQNPCMCVAFLGPNWTHELFENPARDDLRAICDLQMGMTPRRALVAGGAPHNDRLRYLPDVEMHAKLYLSDTGAVVCSANASARALSSKDRVEDGVWLGPSSDAYAEALRRFEKRYDAARPVDKEALDAAPEGGGEAAGPSELSANPTIVEALRHDPDIFRGVRFVCSTEVTDRLTREAADQRIDEESTDEEGAKSIGTRDYFSGWQVKETAWPVLFISVHRGAEGKFYLQKQRHFRFLRSVRGKPDEEPVDVFVSMNVRWDISGAASGDLPRFASKDKCRTELQSLLPSEASFEPFLGKILTGSDFADLLPRN